MKITFAYRVFPVIVITVKRFFKGFDAMAIPLLIMNFAILKKKEEREWQGNLAHELCHIKQAIQWLVIPWVLMYFLSQRFRLKMEAEAFAIEATYQPYPLYALERYAVSLSTKYRLDNYELSQIQGELKRQYEKVSD